VHGRSREIPLIPMLNMHATILFLVRALYGKNLICGVKFV